VSRVLSIGALVTMLCVSAASPVWGQAGQQGSITGTVSDQQGFGVPGAEVSAVNQNTNVTTTARTNDSGVYLLPSLINGRYRLTFTMSSFASQARDVEVRVGDRLRIDITLRVGGATAEVTVTEETPLLETTTATRSTVIDVTQLETLPINGRNVYTLVHITPGVVTNVTRASISFRPFDNGGMDSFSINGGVNRSNLFLLDGATNTANEGGNSGSLAFVPPVEAVEEVRVSTNVYDAQYGRTGGGVVNVSVRSGTNAFRGTASYLHRDKNLGAQLFQDRGEPKSDLYHYNPAFTAGGPVVLPGYDGRNKTFFFGSFEYLSSQIPAGQNLQQVPTDLEFLGNFSQSEGIAPAGTFGGANIYNPLTGQPFPGNIIPDHMIDPVARLYLPHMLRANVDPDASGNNFRAPSSSRGDTYHSYLAKISQNLGAHRVFVTVAFNTRHETRDLSGRNQLNATATPNHYRWNPQIGFDWTTPLGNGMVSTFKAGWSNHNRRDGLLPDFAFDSATLGYSQAYLGMIPRTNFFHPISVAGYNGAAVGTANNTHLTHSNVFHASEVLTKIAGQHQIKMGGEWGLNIDETGISTGGADVGAFAFERQFTSQTPTVNNPAAGAGGNAFASFLLGYPRSSRIIVGARESLNWSTNYLGLFVQDDWRATNRLTVNLGLRWDYEQPARERDNLAVAGWSFGQPLPLNCTQCAAAAVRPDINNPALANLTGGVIFADGGLYETDWNNIGPRVGMTYQMTDKLVLQGGWGVSYLNQNTDRGTTFGVTATTNYVSSLTNNATPRTNLSETLGGPLYPDGLVTPIVGSLGQLSSVGGNPNFDTRDREIQQYQSWSTGFQYQLPWRSVVKVDYVGSRTVNRPITLQLNDLTLEQIALGDAFLDALVPNPFQGLLPGTNFNGATIARRQLLRQYPAFNNVQQENNPLGKLSYQSLQVTWDKRLSRGVNMLVAYTRSEQRELVSPLNQGDPLFEQYTGDHRPHAFRLSGGWLTPALENRGGFVRHALGHWQISATTSIGLGQTVGMPGNVDLIGNPVLDNPTKARWFNTCTLGVDGVTRSFCASDTEQPAFQLRPNNARDTTGARLDGVYRHNPMFVDMQVSKRIQGPGATSYQIRVDLYNMFNTVHWGNPNTNVAQTTFGTVGDNQANDPLFAMLTLKASF
jgi:hypothetical protein